MSKPTPLIRSDIQLRIFLDTNILIDFINGYDDKKAKTFIDYFKLNDIDFIELVSSDYVLWEFYGHFKNDLYFRKLIFGHNYDCIGASRECKRGNFRRVSMMDMEILGKDIQTYAQEFEDNPITVERLIDKRLPGFADFVEKILVSSKFSYKDAIVFASAITTLSHMIITEDESFSSGSHLTELKKALKAITEVSQISLDIEFKKPVDFSSKTTVFQSYTKWFLDHNEDKELGKVFHVWNQQNTIGIECSNNFIVSENDFICLIKFSNREISKEIFKIEQGNMKDFESKQVVTQGSKVTIKLPDDKEVTNNMLNARVFLYSS